VSIRTLRDGETLTIVGVRELHALNWNTIMNEVARRLDMQRTRIVEIDLSETQFIDSFGIDSLQALERLVRQSQGVLRIKNPTPLARSILAANSMQGLISASVPLIQNPCGAAGANPSSNDLG